MATSRILTVAAAQLGPIQLATPRSEVLERMLNLLEKAGTASPKINLVAYPELALTTFFPRHIITDSDDVSRFFEPESASKPHAITQNPQTKPLFDRAKALDIDISLGYAESWTDADGKTTNYNTMIYYSAMRDSVLSKYRKVHLPGTPKPVLKPNHSEQLEKMYFANGNLGFQAFRVPGLVKGALKQQTVNGHSGASDGMGDPILGMLLCNDRRWPEAWREYGLQGAELILQGYNTCGYAPQLPGNVDEQEQLAIFHHRLSCQAGSYQNACFSINPGKAGYEDGGLLIACSIIVHPNGKIIAESKTKDDELITATIDLSDCRDGKTRVFAFEKHRRIEHYGRIGTQTGAVEPPLLEN